MQSKFLQWHILLSFSVFTGIWNCGFTTNKHIGSPLTVLELQKQQWMWKEGWNMPEYACVLKLGTALFIWIKAYEYFGKLTERNLFVSTTRKGLNYWLFSEISWSPFFSFQYLSYNFIFHFGLKITLEYKSTADNTDKI